MAVFFFSRSHGFVQRWRQQLTLALLVRLERATAGRSMSRKGPPLPAHSSRMGQRRCDQTPRERGGGRVLDLVRSSLGHIFRSWPAVEGASGLRRITLRAPSPCLFSAQSSAAFSSPTPYVDVSIAVDWACESLINDSASVARLQASRPSSRARFVEGAWWLWSRSGLLVTHRDTQYTQLLLNNRTYDVRYL